MTFLGFPSPPEWMESALCVETDPESFFPDRGGSAREARKVCLACPVRDDCLSYALEHDERHGIWAGLTEHDRRRIRLGRRTPEEVEQGRAIRRRLRPDDRGAA